MANAIVRAITTTNEIIELCRDHLAERGKASCVRGTYEGLSSYPVVGSKPDTECDDCRSLLECADCGHVYSSSTENHECPQQREANRRAQRDSKVRCIGPSFIG